MENVITLKVDWRALLCYMNFGVCGQTQAGFFLPKGAAVCFLKS